MVRAQTATPSEGDRRHGGRKVREHSRSGSDRGNGSDNEAPLKRQKIGVDALPYNVSLVSSVFVTFWFTKVFVSDSPTVPSKLPSHKHLPTPLSSIRVTAVKELVSHR